MEAGRLHRATGDNLYKRLEGLRRNWEKQVESDLTEALSQTGISQ